MARRTFFLGPPLILSGAPFGGAPPARPPNRCHEITYYLKLIPYNEADGSTGGRRDGQTHRRAEGRTERRTDGRTNRWTENLSLVTCKL